MKTLRLLFLTITFFSTVLFAQKYAVTSGTWNGNIWANSENGSAGETTQPTSEDDVIFVSGITVAVNDAAAQCKNLSFNDTTANISLAAGAVLSVAGNFTLAATNHRIFSSWADGAKLRFNGIGTQVLSGLATGTTAAASTNPSTVLMEVEIDKPVGDTIRTPGTDMKLAIGKSLNIISGIFVLSATDDINGRDLGFNATQPTITIEANGKFALGASASHIRGGTSGTNPIGKMTIRGSVTVSTTSTNRLNIGNIDIEAGGLLTLNTGWSSSNLNLFNPGIITVKEEGTLYHTTTTNIWAVGTTMLLNKGGIYKTSSSATFFPPTFSNNGTVRYTRTTTAQTIVDMDYSRLEVSFDSTKVWTLSADRVISDSLELNNSSTLKIISTTPHKVTVNGTIRLTSGVLDNSDANAILSLGEDALISRATGRITNEPETGNSVNVRYTSSVQTVSTGPEIPTASTKLKKMIIDASSGVELGADITVNDSLIIDDGFLFLGDKSIHIASSANIGGNCSDTAMVVQSGNGLLNYSIASPKILFFPLGDTSVAAKYTPVKLNFTSGNFSNANVNVKVISQKHPSLSLVENNVINRYWTVNQTGISDFSTNVEFTYNDGDVVGDESKLVLGQYTGNAWKVLNAADITTNTLSGTVTEFSDFTAVEQSAISSVESNGNELPTVFSLDQNYPNPFNPVTTISYGLPVNDFVSLKVYDIVGREVATLVKSEQNAGKYSIQFETRNIASGVYFYKLQAGSFVQVKKMLIQK